MEYSEFINDDHRAIYTPGHGFMITKKLDEPKPSSLATSTFIPRQEVLIKLDAESAEVLINFIRKLPQGEPCDDL